jgi:23S rRNA (cytosine1962-C5)-methyltransferase
LLVRDAKTRLDAAFFRARIERAIALRRLLGLPSEQTTGFRLVHSEGDGLPGLIVDRFGDVLVVQIATLGMKQREALVHEALLGLLAPRAIVDRTSEQVAKTEGFEPSSGVVRGDAVRQLEVVERGLRFQVPLELGQKTGFYFDQRALRARVEQLAHGGARVLDVYSFIGAFAVAAARGGACEVVAVDESALAVEVGAACAALNGVDDRVKFIREDAKRALLEAKGAYDLVIADPPRFAPTRSVRQKALVAYTKLAENACRATKPGGIVVFCSCSAAIDLITLTRALGTAATRVNLQATVLERWFQGADHPVPAAFSEGLYLKALVARVDSR